MQLQTLFPVDIRDKQLVILPLFFKEKWRDGLHCIWPKLTNTSRFFLPFASSLLV